MSWCSWASIFEGEHTFPTRVALPVEIRRREPRPDRKLYSMSLLLGIIVLRCKGPPYVPFASYQLNIASFHTLLDISPPQHPDISSIQLHCSCSLLSLHLYLSGVPQYTTKDCVVFVWLVDHTDPSCSVIQLPQSCGKRGKECSVIV